MKKIIAIIATIIFATTNVQARSFYVGPTAGLNISTLTKQSYSKARWRGNVGVQAGYMFSNILGIHAEVLYSWQGTAYNNTDDIRSFNYIKVPVLARLNIIGGLSVEAGLGFNFLINSNWQMTDPTSGERVTINTTQTSQKFDLTIPIGINYLFFKKLELGLRYDISTIRVPEDSANQSRNSNISLNLRYRF